MAGGLEMLRSTADFVALQSDARSRGGPLLLVRYRRNELERTRYGISTGRRLGGAVERNGVRRRLRELLRRLDGRVAAGWDILVVARPDAAAATQVELGAELERALDRSGLLQGKA